MQVSTGLFTEDCFVLVNGEYTEDLVFRIIEMGMPIFEKRENTLYAFINKLLLLIIIINYYY